MSAPSHEAALLRTRLMVWWIIWLSLLAGVCVIYVALGRGPVGPAAANPFENLVGLVPLFVSIIVRWLVLPRYTDGQKAFVMFIVGCALAESCAILGIFLGGPYRDDLFVLGVLGIAQFVPFYARRLYEPKAQGFFPNN
jgi:F0F1-type ATP synthase membrane subunit c/vacuolar-type H+-ATPase subunit K